MKTAVLFLIFNRPDTAEQVFGAIREARPPRLYVAADGPRADRPGETEKCARTRAIIDRVDWPCEVHRLFRDENLGCGRAVSGAIGWFFEHEPEGIVLEDDCLPHPDFFPYCEQMLDRYRDDPRVMFISGRNYLFDGAGERPADGCPPVSYYFSAFNHVWGWAAWRRTWEVYDFTLSTKTPGQFDRVVRRYFSDKHAIRFWNIIFRKMKLGMIDTWDYQFTISLWFAGGLSVIPYTNLVRNIGFDAEATHTHDADERVKAHDARPILPLVHNDHVEQDRAADERHMRVFQRVRVSPLRYAKHCLRYKLRSSRLAHPAR